ncbi:MAG: flagellar biosynthetic protein FliQ [Pseudomonadota bacterium]
MGNDLAMDLWRQALVTAATVAAPFLIVGVVVGVGMAIIQAATQVQEASLSFVPKIVVLALMLVLFGPYLMDRLTGFTTASITRMAEIGRTTGQ